MSCDQWSVLMLDQSRLSDQHWNVFVTAAPAGLTAAGSDALRGGACGPLMNKQFRDWTLSTFRNICIISIFSEGGMGFINKILFFCIFFLLKSDVSKFLHHISTPCFWFSTSSCRTELKLFVIQNIFLQHILFRCFFLLKAPKLKLARSLTLASFAGK